MKQTASEYTNIFQRRQVQVQIEYRTKHLCTQEKI